MASLLGMVLLLAIGHASAGDLASTDAQAVPVRRDILLLSNLSKSDRRDVLDSHLVAVHTPLEHLGLLVRHHDWTVGLEPEVADADSLRGALVWFRGASLREPDRFLRWAIDFMDTDRYLVVLGDLAFLRSRRDARADPALVERFFERLGMSYTAETLDDFDALQVLSRDTRTIGFEKPLGDDLATAPQFRLAEGTGRSLLQLGDRQGNRSDVVALTEAGGLAYSQYGYTDHSGLDHGYWVTDPLRFLRSAFRMDGVPVPDTTTRAGRRVFLSHVSGAGWNRTSAIADRRGVRLSSAAVTLQRLIAPYPDLPVSVGPIAADLHPAFLGSPLARRTARAMFALPQVEPAAHGWSEPLDWEYFSPLDYDQTHEKGLAGRTGEPRSTLDGLLDSIGVHLRSKKAQGAQYDDTRYPMPRTYYTGPFDLDRELDAAIDFVSSLAPTDKPARLMLWTGDDPRPFEAALARLRVLGVANLGGAQPRLDGSFPALVYLAPQARAVGDEVQVQSALSSDVLYERSWPDRYFGFENLIDSIERTESPVRLRPIHVNYHVYSAEQHSTLKAVEVVLDDVRQRVIHPVRASRHARTVVDARQTRLIESPRGWSVRGRGELDTVRVDGELDWSIDYRHAAGVLGHLDYQGSRYIALDPAVRRPFIARSSHPSRAGYPILHDSRWSVSSLVPTPDGARFDLQGFGRGTMRWQMPTACTTRTAIRYADGERRVFDAVADARGQVTIRLDRAPTKPAAVTLECVKSRT